MVRLPPQQPRAPVPEPNTKGVVGLANMGNTCYANAALQCFRHHVELSAFFLEGRHEDYLKNRPVQTAEKTTFVRGYADLLRSLWSASRPAWVRPTGFWQATIPAAVRCGFEQFQLRAQHDSHEFLVFLMDCLHEGLAEEVAITIQRPPPQNDGERVLLAALEAWKAAFTKSYSPLTDICFGLSRQVCTCQKCGNQSSRFETFNMLKVQVPAAAGGEPATLEKMMEEEYKEEVIEEYACEKCKPERGPAIRKTYLWRLPRCLVLVLKRFSYDGRKINTPVKLGDIQNIQFSPWFSAESPERSRSEPYEVFAIVDHHGSMGGGHYTAQAKNPLNQKWWFLDDDRTQGMEEPFVGASTYILFLRPRT